MNLSTPFRDLLFEVWGRRRTDFRPVTFKDSLASKYSQFEGFRQVQKSSSVDLEVERYEIHDHAYILARLSGVFGVIAEQSA